MHQIICRLGLRPRPHWGAYGAPPDPLAGLGDGALGEREGGRGGERSEGRGAGSILRIFLDFTTLPSHPLLSHPIRSRPLKSS